MNLNKVMSLSGLLFSLLRSAGAVSQVDGAFLDAVREVESAGGKRLVGDNGKALGPYQFHFESWDYTKRHLVSEQSLKVSYSKEAAFKESLSREYASLYCQFIENCLEAHKIKSSPALVYACYNYGLRKVLRVKGNALLLPVEVRRNMARFNACLLAKQSSRFGS